MKIVLPFRHLGVEINRSNNEPPPFKGLSTLGNLGINTLIFSKNNSCIIYELKYRILTRKSQFRLVLTVWSLHGIQISSHLIRKWKIWRVCIWDFFRLAWKYYMLTKNKNLSFTTGGFIIVVHFSGLILIMINIKWIKICLYYIKIKIHKYILKFNANP